MSIAGSKWKEAVIKARQEREDPQPEQDKPLPPGVCKCGNDGNYRLGYVERKMMRKCRQCGDQVEV